jgi:hypothetical protein
MAEQDWTSSKVMQEHLQNLVSQEFMMAAELVTCRVPKDPMPPALAEVYMVSFMVFYEWGFGVPTHRFLYSLLQHYRLELHQLAPSRILHIAVFMTLCETYLGIDPYFDMWNYFFCVHRTQDLNVVLTIWGEGGGVVTTSRPDRVSIPISISPCKNR